MTEPQHTRGVKERHLVTPDDVAGIVSEKTGIPLTNLTLDESAKLLKLER